MGSLLYLMGSAGLTEIWLDNAHLWAWQCWWWVRWLSPSWLIPSDKLFLVLHFRFQIKLLCSDNSVLTLITTPFWRITFLKCVSYRFFPTFPSLVLSQCYSTLVNPTHHFCPRSGCINWWLEILFACESQCLEVLWIEKCSLKADVIQ